MVTLHSSHRGIKMEETKNKTRKKAGFILFGVVLFCWIAVAILPFFNFPFKIIIITSLLVGGEILFVITIALLGKEYWSKIKKSFLRFFRFKRKKNPDETEPEPNDPD